MTTILNEAKDPSEAITITFDFSDETSTITGPVVEADAPAGASALTFSAAAIFESSKALVRVSGGTSGYAYAIRCQATATNGDTLVVTAMLRVRRIESVKL